MARVPVIGRLFWFEYLALFASLILVLLEWIIHIITFCLREYTWLVDVHLIICLFPSKLSVQWTDSYQPRQSSGSVTTGRKRCSTFSSPLKVQANAVKRSSSRTRSHRRRTLSISARCLATNPKSTSSRPRMGISLAFIGCPTGKGRREHGSTRAKEAHKRRWCTCTTDC